MVARFLGQIPEVAVEYGLIDANPAKGRRRRLKPQKTAPVWLDRAEHIKALLDATGELDQRGKAKGGHDHKGGLVYRRALLSTLVFAGLRIGELPRFNGGTLTSQAADLQCVRRRPTPG